MISGIYIITHIGNGMLYVGSTVDYDKRISEHKKWLKGNYHHSIFLQRAWNKYGERQFEFFLIEECEKEILLEREQYWMDFYKSYNPRKGYNINPIAGSRLGSKHSDDTKKIMSEYRNSDKYWWKGRKHTPEAIENIRRSKSGVNNPFYGKHLSEEHKKKISENNGKGFLGKKHSDETKKKISEKMFVIKERYMGENNPAKRPEVREKIRQSKLGIKRGKYKK